MSLRPRTPVQLALVVMAALVLLWLAVVHPLWLGPWREVEDEISRLQERQARIEAQRVQGRVLAGRMDTLEVALLDRPGLLQASSEGLAVAGLVQRLEAVVQQVNPDGRSCVLNERSPLPVVAEGGFAQVAVQARLRCGNAELARVLDQLEHGAPRLFVEELEIQAQRQAMLPGESGLGLDVGLRLVGYMPASAAGVSQAGGGGR